MVTVFLRHYAGKYWTLTTLEGKLLTGPHPWGLEHEALAEARNFVYAWGWSVQLEKK